MEFETDLGVKGEPMHRLPSPYLFVILCGIITSILALAGVHWLTKNTTDLQIMGWYANYVIPAGAILVGLVAGSGYGIASWFTGVRISRWLLLTVLLLQTAAYVGAEYVEYRDVLNEFQKAGLVMVQPGDAPSFLKYYDWKARNFAWKDKNFNGAPERLGGWGYVFVLLGAGRVHPGRPHRAGHPFRGALLRRLPALHDP